MTIYAITWTETLSQQVQSAAFGFELDENGTMWISSVLVDEDGSSTTNLLDWDQGAAASFLKTLTTKLGYARV